MSSNDDYYKFLDVPPTASLEEIRSVFRRMAFKYHPDRNKDPWAETIFMQINEAYQVLGNPKKRAAYDAERRAEAQRAEERQRGQQGPRYTLAQRENKDLRPRLMDLIWRKSDALLNLWC